MNYQRHSLKIIFFAVAFCLLAAEVTVLQLPLFKLNPQWFTMAVAADLSLVAPLVLFFSVRLWRPLRPKTLLFFIAVGAFVGGLLTGTRLWFVALAIESVALLFLLSKLNVLVKQTLSLKQKGYSLPRAICLGSQDTVKALLAHPAFRLTALDIKVWRYSVFSAWQKQSNEAVATFSYYQLGNPAIRLAIGFMIISEALPQHLLVHQWSPLAAWLLTATNIYGLMWLFADYKAMQLKPVALRETKLDIYCGFRGSVSVPLEQIVSITPFEGQTMDKNATSLSSLKEPQLIIELKSPVEVQKLFGTVEAGLLYVSVDDPHIFIKRVMQQREELCG